MLDRCLEPVCSLLLALTGDARQAEELAIQGVRRTVRALPSFEGDVWDLDVAFLRDAANVAWRRGPAGLGLRQSLAQLSASDYELVALRVYARLPTGRLVKVLASREPALRAQLLGALRSVAGEGQGGIVPWGPDLTEFDAAVDGVLAGRAPREAAATVNQPADVLARLRTVASLGLRRPPRPDSDLLRRVRAEVLAVAVERRVAFVQSHLGGPVIGGQQRKPNKHPIRGWLLLAVVLALAVGLGSTIAVLSSFADPDSPTYGVKRFGEATLVAVNTDPVARANLEANLAQARTLEAEDMAAKGRGPLAAQAVSDRSDDLRAASNDLLRSQNRGSRWRTVRDRVVAIAGASLSSIESDLASHGQPVDRDQVRNLDQAWLSGLPAFDRRLGKTFPLPATPTPPPG